VRIVVVFPDLGVLPDRLVALSPAQFVLVGFGALLVGVVGGASVVVLRWYLVENRAREREMLIDESFVRTIAFVYALSRSGMLFPEIMRTVARNRKAFGESAEEIDVAVKQMDLFGADTLTALQRTAEWTPSEQFAEFV